MERLQTPLILIQKCYKYNMLLHLVFIDHNKAFDMIDQWDVFKTMDNAREDSRY